MMSKKEGERDDIDFTRNEAMACNGLPFLSDASSSLLRDDDGDLWDGRKGRTA